MISVTVVRSDGGHKAITAPESTTAAVERTGTTATAPTSTANPTPDPVAAPPHLSEAAAGVVGSSSTPATATRVVTINY
jgi:hypothetical protein